MAPRALVFALVVGPVAGLRSRGSQTAAEEGLARSKTHDLGSYTFKTFVRDFQRTYEEGSHEWATREALFNQRLSTMIEHNAVVDRSWNMGLSKFMDYTEAEKKRQLGYTGRGSREASGVDSSATALRRSPTLPASFSVTSAKRTTLLNIVRDQGNCGSCWAEAATSTFEGQMEVNSTLMEELESLSKTDKKVPTLPTMSSQTVVSCTPNKKHCGGTGGCGGATVELAYDMVMANGGLPFAVEWSYAGMDETCRQDVFKNHRINMASYTVLPSNKLSPLQEALVSSGGPVAVSVDASSWFMYSDGIYSPSARQSQFTVNHAVTLMGYRMPEGTTMGYWDIKNSWGTYWGESGHIRIEMKENEEHYCGWDLKTHDGLACDGDPDKAWVCGTCGILYDSAYPRGLHLVRA